LISKHCTKIPAFFDGNFRLAIEVADASLAYDLKVKAPRYAAAGIQEYWVVIAPARTLWVFRGPSADGWVKTFDGAAGEQITPLCAPGLGLSLG
jgi:Uma2 family endonuclease